jgi:3',5'-cyclic AMP phosphodiesterase CpdA
MMKRADPPHATGWARRDFIATAALAGGAWMGTGLNVEGGPTKNIFHEGTVARIGDGRTCVLRFAHITDTHYYTIDETRRDFAVFEKYMKSRVGWHTEAAAADIYAELQRRNIDFAIHTGDVVDYIDTENLDYFDRVSRGIPFLVHYCLGNHDYSTFAIRENGAEQWGFENRELAVAAWKQRVKRFTDRYFTFVNAGFRFILLDNALRSFDAAQLEWLDAQLAASAEPCILAFHIPLYSEGLEALVKPDLLMPPSGAIYDILGKRRKVVAILAGHIHRITESEVQGIPQFTENAVYHRSFRIVECYAGTNV